MIMTRWKTVLMLLIGKLVLPEQPVFYRTQLMKQDNQDTAVKFLHQFFNYKEHPEKVEQTMQRVLQDLRDDGYVEFFYPIHPGKYKLTKSGYKKLAQIREELCLWDGVSE